MGPYLILGGYLLLVNLVGFLMMWQDKRRATLERRRIPERSLFVVALLGGAPGCIAGMRQFRHKTKHKRFVFGLPAIWLVQVAAVAGLLWLLYGRG